MNERRRLILWRVIVVAAALLLLGSIVMFLLQLSVGHFDLVAVLDLAMGVLLVTAGVLNLRAIARLRRDPPSSRRLPEQ